MCRLCVTRVDRQWDASDGATIHGDLSHCRRVHARSAGSPAPPSIAKVEAEGRESRGDSSPPEINLRSQWSNVCYPDVVKARAFSLEISLVNAPLPYLIRSESMTDEKRRVVIIINGARRCTMSRREQTRDWGGEESFCGEDLWGS